MPVTVTETNNSGGLRAPAADRSYTLRFDIEGAVSRSEARSNLLAYAPKYVTRNGDNSPQAISDPPVVAPVDALLPADVNVDPGDGPLLFRGTIRYESRRGPTGTLFPGKTRRTFSTSGGTRRMKYSRNTTVYGPSGPDVDGIEHHAGDEDARGVDAVIPAFEITYEEAKPTSEVDVVYVTKLHEMTGTVNSDTFDIFDPGEALFLGVEGRDREDGFTDLAFTVAASVNRTESFGGESNLEVGGWDYTWRRRDFTESGKIMRLFVEQIYERKPFADLDIDLDNVHG
ncbi:MAG: hypothetical protein AAF561_00410 [Planctomycetota bacterium]